jgi:hypothetical protein
MDISEFKKKPGTRPFLRHPWEIARGKFITGLVRQTKQSPAHIADIGCGDGYIIGLLAAANSAGLYSAFDNALDQDMLDGFKKEGRQHILFFRSLEDPGVSKLTRPDIVLILDVLEHVSREEVLIGEVKKYLHTDPGTRWIITVPAFQSVFSHHDVQLGHYRRYTIRELTKVCERNGLLIEKKGYFFLSLLIARAIQRIGQKKGRWKNGFREQDTIQKWSGGRLLTGLYLLILRVDYNIGKLIGKTGLNIPGLSCYCICHQS